MNQLSSQAPDRSVKITSQHIALLVFGFVMGCVVTYGIGTWMQTDAKIREFAESATRLGESVDLGEISEKTRIEVMARTLSSMQLYDNDDLLIGTTFTDSEVETAYKLVETYQEKHGGMTVWLKPTLKLGNYYFFMAKLDKRGHLEFHGYLVDVDSQEVVPVNNYSGLVLVPKP